MIYVMIHWWYWLSVVEYCKYKRRRCKPTQPVSCLRQSTLSQLSLCILSLAWECKSTVKYYLRFGRHFGIIIGFPLRNWVGLTCWKIGRIAFRDSTKAEPLDLILSLYSIRLS